MLSPTSRPSLRVTNTTSLEELHKFVATPQKRSKEIHGRKNADGTITLYFSNGRGTGVCKRVFPQTLRARRENAYSALFNIVSHQKNMCKSAEGLGLIKYRLEFASYVGELWQEPVFADQLEFGLQLAAPLQEAPEAKTVGFSSLASVSPGRPKPPSPKRLQYQNRNGALQNQKVPGKQQTTAETSTIAVNFDGKAPVKSDANVGASGKAGADSDLTILQNTLEELGLFHSDKEIKVEKNTIPLPPVIARAPRRGAVNPLFDRQNFKAAENVRSYLPAGIAMDRKGYLSGTQRFDNYPNADDAAAPGKSYAEELRSKRQEMVDSGTRISAQEAWAQQPAGTSEKPPAPDASLQNVQVVHQALADFERLNYEIESSDGSFDVHHTQPGKPNNVSSVIASLHALTGNEAATLVLSSVLTQATLSSMSRLPAERNGSPLSKLEMVSSGTARTMKPTIIGANGEKQPVQCKAMGGAKWKVSRDGDNFKIAIDWQNYYRPKYGEKHVPMHTDGVIGVHYQTEIFVNAAEACQGRVELTMPDGVNVTFSGRFDLEQEIAAGRA